MEISTTAGMPHAAPGYPAASEASTDAMVAAWHEVGWRKRADALMALVMGESPPEGEDMDKVDRDIDEAHNRADEWREWGETPSSQAKR